MQEFAVDSRKWKELGFGEKLKFSIAGSLVTASIILGFVSFILLFEIPWSVSGLIGIWLSTALATLGIAAHFNNEMVKFQTHVQDRLKQFDEREKYFEEQHEIPNTD